MCHCLWVIDRRYALEYHHPFANPAYTISGGAYQPALSSYTIMVENQAQVFLGGPPLVKMATGEVVEAEELGGARMHGTLTGLADQIATDEYEV